MVTPQLFISYARRDGRDLALRLQADLIAAGYAVWLDTAEIEGGASWSVEIERAIDGCAAALALLSHGSFASEICRAEQLRALRKRKRVIPVKVQADAEQPLHLEALNYRDFSDPARYAAMLDLLKADLAGESADFPAPPPTPTNADPLPSDYVERPEIMALLRAAVLDDATDRRVALTALQGMGGIGKSVLAAALCHDEVVRDAFPDGVIWVKVGQTPGSLVPHLRLIGTTLGDAAAQYSSDTEAESRLRMLLPGKSALIVLDDIWDARHVYPFVVEAPRCRILFTTRNAGIAGDALIKAASLTVHEMKPAEALTLLRGAVGRDDPLLAEIAREVGYHPLALSLAGGRLKADFNPADWLRDFRAMRTTVIRQNRAANQRHNNLEACFNLSIEALAPADRPLYHTLGIFAEDVWIPRETVLRLWRAYGLSDYDARDLLGQVSDLGLVEKRDADGALALHDLLHDYNLNRLGDIPAAHGALIAAWGDPLTLPDAFAWTHYAYHLIGAGQPDHLRDRLLDFRWLRAKLNVTDASALLADYDLALAASLSPTDEPNADLRLVASAISMSAHVLNPNPAGLASQLTGRLLRYRADQPPIAALLAAAERHTTPAMLLTSPTLNPAGGALIRTLAGHTDGVSAAAWSPDGTRIASASHDRTLKLWDAATGRELLTLAGNTSVVKAAAWSPDGTRIASASYDGTLKLWEAATGRELLTLTGHTQAVNAVAWSPDGTRLVSASNDKTLKLWEASAQPASGHALLTLTGHTDLVNAAAWSPDGTRLVSASHDGTLKLWDAATGRELRTLAGHTHAVNAAAWSPDGTRIASASYDGTLKLWEAATGRELLTLAGHTNAVNSAAWSPDGTRLISTSSDRTLKLWDSASGQELRALTGHTGGVTAAAWSPDGMRLVSASDDGTLKLWDAAAQPASGGRAVSAPPRSGHTGGVNALAWSPDGTRLVSASSDKTLKLWEAAAQPASGRELLTLAGHTSRVTAAAWSPDGTRLVSASSDKTLKLWDAATGRELLTLAGYTGWVMAAAWSPDGTRLISASSDRTLKLWAVASGHELLTLEGHTQWVYAAAWSPDGTRIISASDDGTLKLWASSSWRELLTLAGHMGGVMAAAWSPDGTRLVSASWDKTLKLWDAASGHELLTVMGHTGGIKTVAWSPDGRWLVSGGGDHTVRVWDAISGAPVARFDADGAIYSVACAPDSRQIAAGDAGGNIHWLRLVGFDGL